MKSKGRVREKWAHDKGHNEDFVFFSFSFFFGWDEILLDVWRSPGNPELLNFNESSRKLGYREKIFGFLSLPDKKKDGVVLLKKAPS